MAKRMLLHYQKGGFPAYEKADEQGMPQPCALGIPWVNPDTQRTLAKLSIPRTDPWGKPLPEPSFHTATDQHSPVKENVPVVPRSEKPTR